MVTKNNIQKKINPNEYGSLEIDRAEVAAVTDVLLNEKIFRYSGINKTKTDFFEDKIKELFKIKFALGVNNGTSALKVALYSIGIKPGDRVLISSYTFMATAEAVYSFGGIPVPIDFDIDTCMELNDVETEIKKGCRAIIAVHLQGRAFDLTLIKKIAKDNNIILIEDSCQAFGAKYKDIYSGCFGDIGVFSFQQNKQLTCGEGGLLITNNSKLYEIARNYTDHGAVRNGMPTWDSNKSMLGDNYRMTNIQAAILLEQLRKFDNILIKQKTNRDYILSKLSSFKGIIYSKDTLGDTGMNILLQFPNSKKAQEAILFAKNNSIELRFLWHKPYYLFEIISKAKLHPNDLGKNICYKAEDISQRMLSVSLPSKLKKDELNQIIIILNKIIKMGLLE